MVYRGKLKWILIVVFGVLLRSVDVQYAMPMPMPGYPPPPAMMPMPAPMPFMCPLPIAVGISGGNGDSTTTTTTTSKPDVAVAIPLPVPMAIPMPVPAMPAMPAMPAYPPPSFCQRPPPRPRNCPPCPPCTCKPACTPSFYAYCSPCHMKCRCKSVEDAPNPIPPNNIPVGPSYAVQLPQILHPAPVVIVPFPPIPPRRLPPRRRPKKPKYSSCSEESSETSSSSDSDYLRRGKRRGIKILRRNPRSSEGENELVKPMLSYISENGDIKFETKISNDDVAELIGEGAGNVEERKYQNVQITTREDESHKSQLVVFSTEGNHGKSGKIKNRRVFLRSGVSNHVLEDGRKQLIFRPPDDKKISNLSVSFQIV